VVGERDAAVDGVGTRFPFITVRGSVVAEEARRGEVQLPGGEQQGCRFEGCLEVQPQRTEARGVLVM
jgi:hypothetical protein